MTYESELERIAQGKYELHAVPSPTPAVLRAAHAILRNPNPGSRRIQEDIAEIIDRETGLPELLAAAKAAYERIGRSNGQDDIPLFHRLAAAIARCEQP